MKHYRRFYERNEHEGEKWNFWLQTDGNELELEKLMQLLEECLPKSHPLRYELTDTVIPGYQVDVLVNHGNDNSGYLPNHTKVSGKFMCPAQPADIEALDELFYKGGIKALFPKWGESDDVS